MTGKSKEELENIFVFYQGDDADVNYESVEAPPEDPGLASTGLVSGQQDSTSSAGSQTEKQNKTEDRTEASEEKAIETTEENPQAEQSKASEEENKTREMKKTYEVSEIPEKSPSKSLQNEPVVQTVQSIRVAVEKLDKLQNLVGETVINQSRLHQLSGQIMTVDESLGEMLSQFVEDNE